MNCYLLSEGFVTVIITIFVIVSSAGIKRVVCRTKGHLNKLSNLDKAVFEGTQTLQVEKHQQKSNIQSTHVISKSKGLSKIL